MDTCQVFSRQESNCLLRVPHIGVDIDGVLADFNEKFLKQLNSLRGTFWEKHHITDYEYHQCIDIEHSAVYEHFDKMVVDGSYGQLLTMPGAKLVNMLPGRVNLVTNRVSLTVDDTLNWLERHGIYNFENLTFVKGSKRCSAESLGEFDYFIEDSLRNALDVLPIIREKIFLMDHPYNQTSTLPDKIIRVSSWNDILNYFISSNLD